LSFLISAALAADAAPPPIGFDSPVILEPPPADALEDGAARGAALAAGYAAEDCLVFGATLPPPIM